MGKVGGIERGRCMMGGSIRERRERMYVCACVICVCIYEHITC